MKCHRMAHHCQHHSDEKCLCLCREVEGGRDRWGLKVSFRQSEIWNEKKNINSFIQRKKRMANIYLVLYLLLVKNIKQ